ncbi:MAG: hypothetical protein RH859_02390 [Longimicrobiales bacterium]
MSAGVTAWALAGLGLATLSGAAVAQPSPAIPGVDTLAVVGGAHETNTLLVYEQPEGLQLVGDATVAYADNAGGRLAVVNLLTGAGWRIDDQGGSGPGEFGGSMPFFGEADGTIHAVAQDGRTASWSLDGTRMGSERFRSSPWEGPGAVFPVGVLQDGTFVVHRTGRPGSGPTVQQELRALPVDGGPCWTVDGLPVLTDTGGELRADTAGALLGDARGGTIAVGFATSGVIRVYTRDGSVHAETRVPHELWRVVVDADERIWVSVLGDEPVGRRAVRTLVFDRDLTTSARVDLRNVVDARGRQAVTMDFDDYGAVRIHLLQLRTTPLR